MSEKTYEVGVLLADKRIETVAVTCANEDTCELIVSSTGNEMKRYAGSDYFEAMCHWRVELEKEDARLLCNGARIDCFPSGMSRSMGKGLTVYVNETGKPSSERLNLFGQAEADKVGTVAEQKQAFDSWMTSLRGTENE